MTTANLTRDELQKLHGAVTAKAQEVMTAKNHDYAHEGDVFRNFRRYGTFGVLVRLSDKLARLDSFEENKEFAVADEKLEDTIVDIINYAVIYLAMKQEGKPKVEVKDGPLCELCEDFQADYIWRPESNPSFERKLCSNCRLESDFVYKLSECTLLERL